MIRFACQQCQKIFKVEDKHAGQNSRCPKCGAVLLIPSTEVNQRQVKDSSLPLDKNKDPTPPSSKISDDDIFDIMNKPGQTHSDNAYDPVNQSPILPEKTARIPEPPMRSSIPMPSNKDKPNTQTQTKSSSIVYLGIGGVLLVG
jgi:DNA-directed RNA polymerase subunit RPC12/RpoP